MPNGYGELQKTLAAIKVEMQKGTPPQDPAARKLVQQGLAGLSRLTGGDPAAIEGLISQYRANPAIGAAFGLDQATFAYIMQALA